MPRITRIAGSFTIVTIVYWAYALLAVPWIEPPADLAPAGLLPPSETRDPIALQLRQLAGLFPADAWELKNPKILESDRAKLLFRDYRNFPDGRVKIDPCTIVFAYEGPAEDEAQRRRQSVILEAPGGAVLQFDQPLDLNRAKVGRLVAGQLNGDVTIRSDWKQPGPNDDLLIQTQNIQLTEQTISTPHSVDFRWGPHFGRGRQMTIKLLAGRPKPGMEGSGPNVAGIESFELRHVERLHLDLGQAQEKGTTAEKTAEKVSGTVSRKDAPQGASQKRFLTPFLVASSMPVEINCRGPFRFDAVNRVATFRDRVDVLQPNPSGPADQIACELLSLYFVERPATGGSPPVESGRQPQQKAAQAASLDLEAERLEARGHPVVVTAPSRNVASRAERLEYNLLKNSISLDGGQEVFLQQGPNEIHARSLYYQSVEPGRLGRVAAQGPGWLRGQSPDRPDQQLEAVWKDQLRVAPDKQNQVISLSGGAELKFRGVGQLQAREIFFWLLETPAAKDPQARLRPDRMLARHDVRMNSPQLSSKVEQLELWFDEGPGAGGGQGGSPPGGPPNQTPPPTGPAVQPPPQQSNSPPRTSQPASVQRFEVVGRVLRARILLGQEQAAVSNLTIVDGVRFMETQTARPDQRPLLIRGDRLEAVDADTANAAIAVTGRPARLEGRGLGLTGSNINLHRGTNRLWIEGAGQMDLPMSGAAPGQPPAAAGPMTVDWRQRMEFDGRTARFEQSVVAATACRQLQTETMQVKLQRPVSFSQTGAADPPQVEEIQCYGGVSLENRDFDQQQQLISHDQMQVADLAVNVQSGALTAGGPGWLNTVRRGSDNPLGGRTAAAGNVALEPVPPQDQLTCLHVRFQKSISGNLIRRQFAFHEQVQTTYAPVDNWNAMLTTNNPDLLGPRGVVVCCDRLSVVEMSLPVGDRRAIELEALGNTKVENATFTALGNRITYAEAKDLLVLEGDGRNNAQLFRQLERGAERSEAAAQRIFYWPKTNRLKIDGAQSLQMGQPPSGNRMQ